MTWDFETEVLVIGLRGAGAVAAITAHDAGAKGLIVGKADYRLRGTKKGRAISDPASFFWNKVALFLNLSPEPPKTQQSRAKKKDGGKFRGANARRGR
jgi:hypothetical protein